MTSTESSGPRPTQTGWYVAAYFLLLSFPAAAAAYYKMFTGFSDWDDEGTMMMSVKEYLAGHRLYHDVLSFYGPVYYFYNWFVRSASGTAVTHDATRMTSVVLWIVCPLICAWIVHRLAKSLPVAAGAYVLTFSGLRFFNTEPGHPQELCILLLVGLVASSLLAEKSRRRGIAMVLVGALAAALLLIKVNVGIFAVLAVALAVLSQSPVTALSRVAAVAAVAAALVLPVALMWIHLDDHLARAYCVMVTASTAALLPGLFRTRKSAVLSFRDCRVAVASFTATIGAAWLVLIAQRVSSYAILDSLVLSNLRVNVVQASWYGPLHLGSMAIPWALGGLGTSIVFALLIVARYPGNAYKLLAPVKLIFGSIALLLPARSLPGFVTPYCWLVLYAPREEMQSEQSFPRSLLAATAVLQTLYAYPLAGSQEIFIRILLLVVAAVSIGDSLLAVARAGQMPTAVRPFVRAFAVGFLVLVPLYSLDVAYKARRQYRSLPSLALPGAERIHLADERVQIYQWLTQNVRQHCDTFMGLPGLPSLYFWTGEDPPTRFNLSNWMYVLNDEQQLEVASALSTHPNGCVVYSPDLVAFWNKGNRDLSRLPLVRYMQDNFEMVSRTAFGTPSPYYLLVRNGRNGKAHQLAH